MSNKEDITIKQKQELFKHKLREKAAKKMLSSHKKQTDTANIPEHFYRFEEFPEYKEFAQQFSIFDDLKIQNPYFRVNQGIVSATTQIDNKPFISYSSYNYLGFSGDSRVSQAAKETIDKYGSSVSASRIATGERPIHRELEVAIADFVGTEDSIVYVGGYGANVTVIGNLLGHKDLIIHDFLSHSSILNGSLLSNAKRLSFPHNDVAALEQILEQNRSDCERVLIVIEGVYSMDGDIAPLPEIVRLKKKFKTLLMVDEAHSIGVLGKTGRGIREHFSMKATDVDLWMGTLSKSFASCGGYIAGSKELVKFLKYNSPGFLYSVGISPANAGAALAAIKLLQVEFQNVTLLQKNARFFLDCCHKEGLDTGTSANSPIIPVIIGNSSTCLSLANALFENGINVQPILYPAVAEDMARLRFFITKCHTQEQMKYTIDKIVELLDVLEGLVY